MESGFRTPSAVHLVPAKLELPFFMLSRVRIKQHHLEPMRNYIARSSARYTNRCEEENATESKSCRKLMHTVGYDRAPSPPCPRPRPLRVNRELTSNRPWQLPPNLYDIRESHKKVKVNLHEATCSQTTAKKKGSTSPEVPKNSSKFCAVDLTSERCARHKGILATDARQRRATNRSMITDPTGCYRDPTHPGPGHYYPQNLSVKKIHPINELNQRPNPHVFLPHSCVPAKPNATHPKNIGFAPGPGRFEIAYGLGCPCPGRLIFMPGLHLNIEREKRKKFRRLPYTKIKARLYCSPEWRHVVGHGFRYLFRQPPKMKPSSKPAKKQMDQKKSQRFYQLYPESRYITMINEPSRSLISRRLQQPPPRPPRLKFNCLQKRVVRRQLKASKKIAFNSTEDRFKDIPRAPVLTVSQQEKIKLLLPLDRQLRDQPVMRVQPDAIKKKLFEPPPIRNEGYDVVLRKPYFKFKSLPGPKIMVLREDVRPEKFAPLFNSELAPQQFFKDDVLGCSESK